MRVSPHNRIAILRQVRIIFMDLIEHADTSLHQH